MKKSICIILTGITLALTSCATIVSGSRQTVKFNSTPSSAKVFINDVEVGMTPFKTKLERKKKDTKVVLKLEGYKDYETKLERKFNAWYIGNIAFGGIIGIIVDPITGAMYRLTPKEINATFGEKTTSIFKNDDVNIAISMEIDPEWEKVGQLTKQ